MAGKLANFFSPHRNTTHNIVALARISCNLSVATFIRSAYWFSLCSGDNNHELTMLISLVFLVLISNLEFDLVRSDGYETTGSSVPNILAIELQFDDQSAFFVATSSRNFALFSPELSQEEWQSLSVNGDQVIVLTSNNSTLKSRLSRLNETTRELIQRHRYRFIENVIGLGYEVKLPFQSTYSIEAQEKSPKASNLNTEPYPGVEPLQDLEAAAYGYKYPGASYDNRCSALMPSFRYMNWDLGSLPESKLPGDIYRFDLDGNIRDIFSSSVSVIQEMPKMSVVFRDFRYFSYSRGDLPLYISRIFLVENRVIIVYKDGHVLVKDSWALNALELDIVLQVRRHLKAVS